MGDEKLPNWLTNHLGSHINECVDEDCKGCIEEVAQIEAIHRYAREREAAALERAAQVCERERQRILADPNDPSWTEHLASASRDIRELKPTEPTNG